MVLPMQCPHCLDLLNLPDTASVLAGEQMRCSKCSELFVVKSYDDGIVCNTESHEHLDEEQRQPNRRKAILVGLGVVLVATLIMAVAFWLVRDDSAQQSPQAPMAAVNGELLTNAECEAFAKLFEAQVNARDATAFITKVDWNQLLERSIAGLPLSPQFEADYRHRVLTKNGAVFGKQVMEALGESGHYRFLRLHEVGGEKRLWFRLAPNGGALNYHDLVLGRSTSGEIQIVDFHQVSSGALTSEILRDAIVPVAAAQKGSLLKKLTGQYSEFEANLPALEQFNAFNKAGRYADALATFKRFPSSVQNLKFCALARIVAASNVNEEEYLDAIADFRRAHPKDADTGIDFLSIEFYFLRKEFDKALQAVDNLDRAVGGDSYLNVIRVNALLEQGKFAEARRLTDLVIQAEPSEAVPVNLLVKVGLKAGDCQAVLEGLKQLQDKHDVTFQDLRDIPEYAEFVKSPQFQEWLVVAKPQ